MPKVRRSRKPPPEGWELIEPTLDELDQKMREGDFPLDNIVGFRAFSNRMKSYELHTYSFVIIPFSYFS